MFHQIYRIILFKRKHLIFFLASLSKITNFNIHKKLKSITLNTKLLFFYKIFLSTVKLYHIQNKSKKKENISKA